MVSRSAIATALLSAASMHGIAHAVENEEISVADNSNAQRSPVSSAIALLPLEEALAQFAKSAKISFIFDSRLMLGKTSAPIKPRRTPEIALRASLETADLELHKINATTYAITANVASSAPAPIVAPAAVSTASIVDTIIVTASAATALADKGSNNLFVFEREALDYLAIVNPAEAIFELPQSLASISGANTTFLGAAAGLNFADLRGLGTERTQALTNGRRRTLTPAGNDLLTGFDLSAIGEPFLERIEISSQFSGARLGPEATAGAINFVTRSGVEGIEVGGLYGISEQGDAQEFSIHGLGGISFANGDGNITVGVNRVEERGLLGRDRELTSTPYGFAIDGRRSFELGAEFLPGFGGSAITPSGFLAGVVTDDGEFISLPSLTSQFALDGNGGLEAFNGSLNQTFNWLEDANTIVPLERTIGFIDASYDVTPKISLFVEAHLGLVQTDSQISAVPALSLIHI